jgi:hypothetical protein
VCSSVAHSQRDNRRCLRQTVGLRDHRQARIRSCRASHLLLASTVQFHVAGSYEDRLISTIQNSSPKLAIRTSSRCLNPALISAAPHYGLRYGSTPATGNFQRLRGRPPLVSPLKSCMGRSFTAVTFVGSGIAWRNLRPLSLTTANCQRGRVGFEVNVGRRSRHHESPRLVATRCESPGAGMSIKGERLWRDEEIASIPSIP